MRIPPRRAKMPSAGQGGPAHECVRVGPCVRASVCMRVRMGVCVIARLHMCVIARLCVRVLVRVRVREHTYVCVCARVVSAVGWEDHLPAAAGRPAGRDSSWPRTTHSARRVRCAGSARSRAKTRVKAR